MTWAALALWTCLAQEPAAALPPWDPRGTSSQDVKATPTAETTPAATPAAPAASGQAEGPIAAKKPPYYTDADMQALRQRYGLEPDPPRSDRRSRWRCLIADPTCGFLVEVQASSGYAYRMRQTDVAAAGNTVGWSTARVSYDVWVSIPTLVETRGPLKYTRLSLGPKGGVIASDGKSLWGNIGFAGRYWLSRGRFAPSIEFSSGLAFRVAGADKSTGDLVHVRGPIGFVADVGVGVGGFGSIVIGGQFDSPLAREDVPERIRTPTAGMFFIAFRGNIVWGAPAVLGVATHAAALRAVRAP